MARDPGSRWAALPEAGAPDGHTKTQFIVHSTGTRASAAANRNYFARGDVVVESTFIVGLSPADPTLQVMDSTDVADANGSANKRAISVETVGEAGDPFNEWQISELIRLGRWAAATHPIAKRVIPSETASGFGWHVMFGAPGPWTSVRGKECPGPKRIQQLKTTVFPAIFANPTAVQAQEDDMPSVDDILDAPIERKGVKADGSPQTGVTSLRAVVAWFDHGLATVPPEVWRRPVHLMTDPKSEPAGQALGFLEERLAARLDAAVAQVIAAVKKP